MANFGENCKAIFSQLDNFVSSKTVVGEPVEMGKITIIPLIDVSFGMGATALNSKEEKKGKSSDGGGMGAKISPSAVIVIADGSVQLINVIDNNSVNKLIDLVPNIVNKFNFFSKINNVLTSYIFYNLKFCFHIISISHNFTY